MSIRDNEKELESGKISTLFARFAIPAIIGMVVQAIYNLIDRIFIGRAPNLGDNALGGAAAAFPVMLITMSLGLWLANGGATLFSISLGAKNRKAAKEYQNHAFASCVIIGISITIFGLLFLEQILQKLGATELTIGFAKDYLEIILYGSVFSSISMFGNNFSRSQGNPKNAMVSMLIGASFNIVFDYILIIKLNMGMKGAALATIGGQFLSAMWQLWFLFGKRSLIPLKLKLFKFKYRILLNILSAGFPIFIVQTSASILTIFLNLKAGEYGSDAGLSTVAILSSVQMLVQMPIVGFIQGQVPIISYNYGAKNFERIKETLKYSILSSTVVLLISAIIIQVFTREIISLFNASESLAKLSEPAIKTAFLFIPAIGIQAMCSSLFQATGHVLQASILNILRQIILLLPLMAILSHIFKFNGIFMSLPISDLASSIITVIAAVFLLRKIKKDFENSKS